MPSGEPDRGATGIIAGSDLMALGVLQAVREAGLEVPRDVSVIGYDDTWLVQFVDPPLTTLRQPVAEMGRATASALADRIHRADGTRGETLFRPELVVRGSTGPPPFRKS